jgi:hypothetical protein
VPPVVAERSGHSGSLAFGQFPGLWESIGKRDGLSGWAIESGRTPILWDVAEVRHVRDVLADAQVAFHRKHHGLGRRHHQHDRDRPDRLPHKDHVGPDGACDVTHTQPMIRRAHRSRDPRAGGAPLLTVRERRKSRPAR